MYKYSGIAHGVYLPDDTALQETADALAIAQQSGDPASALLARGITLVHRDGPECEAAYDLLAQVRAMALAQQHALLVVAIVDTHTAIRKAQMADFDGAIELCVATLDHLVASGDGCWRALATTTLVESLLRRGADGDLAEAQAAIARLAAVPTDPGYVMRDVRRHQIPRRCKHLVVPGHQRRAQLHPHCRSRPRAHGPSPPTRANRSPTTNSTTRSPTHSTTGRSPARRQTKIR
jgi:hypothetical protein